MMVSFSKFRFFLLVPVLWLSATTGATPAVEVDRVVAVVNKDVITGHELRERIAQATARLKQQKIELPPASALRSQVLQQLILEHVQLQRAAEGGLSVTDEMLTRAIDGIAQNNKMTQEQLLKTLKEEGISWSQFREQVRREMLLSRLREEAVEQKIMVSDAEVDRFLKQNPDFLSGRKYLVAHMLFKAPAQSDDLAWAKVKKRAEAVLEKIKAGEDFGKLAARYSEAPDAVKGGLLGWRALEDLPVLFAEAIKTQQPGSVSPILRSDAGLHIVFFVNARGEDLKAAPQVRQTRARHILLKTATGLSDDDARARLLGLRERILNGESFAELARVHSEDISGVKGGDLGWLNPGDTVAPFERAMDALKPGEISMPVKSTFGWHLIQLNERRMQDMSDKIIRSAAFRTLRQRKSNQAFDRWLRELRDSAYVQIRMENE